MQVLQNNFFSHLNSRLVADGGFGGERQLLVEEQKLCKTRARKFYLETNRRRKALEERRKQWDVQEQRLRENILQQRRKHVQDATERFQRAHLPPSQRCRHSFRRNVPNIEHALSEIQGTLNSYTQQSSFLSSNSNISRTSTPSSKPPAVSKSSHRQALSAVEAYTKLLQEQSMICFKNSDETENRREKQKKQQEYSPQDSQQSDCNSESLSSKDSLENEDPNHSTKHLQCSYSSFMFDSEKSHPDLRNQHDLYPASDLTHSAMMLLGENFGQSRKLHKPKEKIEEDSEGLDNKMKVSESSWGLPFEQTPEIETQPALHNSRLLSICEIIGADPEHFDINSPENSLNDNIFVTNRVTPSNTALDSLCPKQKDLLDLGQQRVHDDRPLKRPSATEILLPAKNGNSNDILFGAPPKPNIFLSNSTTYNASQEETLKLTGKKSYLSSQKEPSAFINNLNKISNPEPTTEKPINTALLQNTCLSNIQSDTPKCLQCPEEEVQKSPVSVGTPHSVCQVRFIKGILKKQSKNMSGDNTYVYGAGHLIFSKQVALEIRDSVELTQAKTKNMEGNNPIKKKLRWFDEVHVDKEDKEQDIMKQSKGKSSNLSQSKNNSKDHQPSVTTVSGVSKPGPIMTSAASTGYHFTKQAWTDVGVQVSLPLEEAEEVKVPRSSTRTGGPKIPRRECSARVGAGPVSMRTRKGTVIRPQSATEVNQIAKTQGKIMVPRPPPRMESVEEKMAYITKTPYGMDHASVNYKQAQALEHKDNSEGLFSPYTHHIIRTDNIVMYTPLPPSYAGPILEGNTKGMPSSGCQETHGCSRRRGMVFNEKGLCLDCTPTDEEISQIWHGVRSALASKDGKAMLRRQALENGRVVRKAFVEPRRQTPGSGSRKLPQPSQPTKQNTEPVRPISNLAILDGGLASAAHLHLAKVNAEGLLEESDIVTTQTQSLGTVQQRSQQQGLTTISMEEQKILLSLDRLNHQLHCEHFVKAVCIKAELINWCCYLNI
uniref:Centrosomal protein 126 n=1 Tax=Mastacembelus armatus TaxID=205130 RepID=A0A3Q3M6D9_9TELE